jgi:outer membrane protein assembly factor BamA
MRINYLYLSFCFLFACIFHSCTTTKFVPEGEYLLDKVRIKSDVPAYSVSELTPYLKQQPNFRMFVFGKVMLHVYNWAGKDNNWWINRLWKKIGDEPVIFDSTLVYRTNREFEKLFVNMGYMHVEVNSEIVKRNKKAEVVYTIKGNEPFRIRNYTAVIEDDSIKEILENIAAGTQPVKSGILFDRNLLNAERERITSLLRNRGYYAFVKENIDYDAIIDTAQHAPSVDLTSKLHRLPSISPEGSYMLSPHKKYAYDKVYIYLDYDPLRMAGVDNYPKEDSIEMRGYTLFYLGKKPSIKPGTMLNNCFISPGETYSQQKEEMTYSAFSTLNSLSNIHIQFDEKIRNDSSLLDCHILTVPAQKQSISFSVEGTNTTGNLGVASSANYTHRNLFRRSESLNLKIRGAYESISNFSNPYLEYGGEATFRFPRFIFPFLSRNFLRTMRTTTEFALNYNYQTRPEYDRTLLSASLTYTWQQRNRLSAQHELDLINVDYVYLPRKDSVFMNNLPPSAQYFGYIDQFIVGMNYTYYNSTFDPQQKQRDAQSIRFSVESAGNLLLGISRFLGGKKDSFGSYRPFNTYFAQFVKSDFDYSSTKVFDKHNSVAWRIGGGIGVPYGNSKMLPFEKRYYAGGANSVRAWPVRELGPGAYVPVDSTTFFNQSGDIKLNLNVEYRTRFFWKLEAAAFIDVGNIWTIRDYAGQENGKFRFDRFYRQIAIGYGLGLRLDYSFFLIRFDCGWKVYDPARKGQETWAILHPNFKENWAWHIAVGYPF